jgi:hypothetical protein
VLCWEYWCFEMQMIRGRGAKVNDNVSGGQQAADEAVRRWISTMQSMADQIQRQQQAFQQMMQESINSYMQLLNTPPFYVSEQSQVQQASQRWMELAQQQQETFQQISQQWMEQARAQQQAFQQIVQQSLSTYMDLFRHSR